MHVNNRSRCEAWRHFAPPTPLLSIALPLTEDDVGRCGCRSSISARAQAALAGMKEKSRAARGRDRAARRRVTARFEIARLLESLKVLWLGFTVWKAAGVKDGTINGNNDEFGGRRKPEISEQFSRHAARLASASTSGTPSYYQ